MKRLPLFFVCLIGASVVSALYGQSAAEIAPAPAPASPPPAEAQPLTRLDSAVKSVAAEIHKKLSAEGTPKAGVGQFTYRDSIPSLGVYWNTQLIQELTNIPNRSWTLLSGPAADAEWTVSGEIVEIANTVRLYTRLVRTRDRAIQAGVQSDIPRDEFIADMLSDGGSGGRGGGGGSSSISRDAYEPDSRENPLAVEIGANAEAPYINRTIHASSDEDFFLLTPDRDGSLTAETSGSIDTYMEFYDAASWTKLSEDDDGGSSGNARIRQTVRAGSRYVAKVRGYSGDTGSYGFHAYITGQVRPTPDEYESDDSFSSAKEISVGTPQRHTFTNGDDVDWVKFRITQAGRYTIRARGVNSNRLDTYIELFDSNQNVIEEDDDGGENMDSRISVRLEAGTYYLKVECLDDEPNQPYTISVETE
jgi:hypothetical protein